MGRQLIDTSMQKWKGTDVSAKVPPPGPGGAIAPRPEGCGPGDANRLPYRRPNPKRYLSLALFLYP